MARIFHSDEAPSEKVHYSFATVEFDLTAKGSYETTDPVTIANAESHPWLSVEYPAVEVIQGAYVQQIAPKDDVLSRMNDIANDPEEVRKAEAAKASAAIEPVAVEAGKDQSTSVETGGIDETLAAADDNDAPKRKKS